MNIYELTTPRFLVDLDILEKNIKEMSDLCVINGKELWPMIKTHKCTDIAKLQSDSGAAGFLTGTLDEAETLIKGGFSKIMLAYPVAGRENINRVLNLAAKADILISLDGIEAARQINEALATENRKLDYLLIIDCGLHRFGVSPEDAVDLVKAISKYERLNFKGIATHPGQVYGVTRPEDVPEVAQNEVEALSKTRDNLIESGFMPEIVATGSTPTAYYTAKQTAITVLRPGNYVFHDHIQIALGIVSPERCALSVLSTIIAHPRPDTFIIDAGSKCLGLDMGAHGNSMIKSFGLIADNPELSIIGLSEEVGKVKINGETTLKIGDKLRIIPNHACSAANMTSYLLGHRRNHVEKIFPVDMRGSSIPSFRKGI